MAHNTCSGVNNNVFGPPQQTLFLGCSIASFSVNVGWNEQVGELTVQLAHDPCAVPPGGRPKVYWDATLTRIETTAADPGFIYPNIGAPVYFRVGDFEWSGLVQSYEENGSVGGKPLYTVKLIDPRQILEGTQLIIGEYAGSVQGTPNLINVYAYAESFGNPAPPNVIAGATFGSPAGAFGGSLSNDNGMPWNIAKGALQVLTSAIPAISNNYSPFGRLVFRGGYGAFSGGPPSSTIGYGIIAEELPGTSMYLLDLSEMPIVPQYWRLAGTSVSLMDAISQVCADAVCDYYIEFLPTNIGGTIYKILKVRTASRALAPVLGSIQDFIDNAAYPVSYSKGLEMRNEVTSALLVGGNVQSIYQAYNDSSPQGNSADIICPYFGLNSYGNVIEPIQVSGIWQFEIELSQVNEQLPIPLAINTAIVTEYELLSSLAGYDIWLNDGEENGYDTVLALNNVEDGFLDGGLAQRYKDAGRPVPPALDLINLKSDASVPFDNISAKNGQILYDFIASIARTYYGQKFMVRLPYTTAKADPESANNNGLAVIKTTELPSDGGWTDETSVIGLPVNSIYTDFFSLPDNRLGCYVGAAVPGDMDVTGMDPNDYWVTTNQDTSETWIYVRAQTEPDIVYIDRDTFYSPRVVVSLSSPILSVLPEDYANSLPNHMAAVSAFYRNKSSVVRDYVKDIVTQGIAGQSVWDDFPPRANMIAAAAIPILSTVQTYGPWVSPLPAYGVTKMERDDGLVPWEYGSTANMNAAGETRALNDTASSMQYAEMGQITVPGYPLIPIGAELGAYDAGIFGGGFHLFETRTSTSSTDNTSNELYNVVSGIQWTGLYGPNITSIGVEFGLSQVTTTYQMRTYTPAFGRFSKINAERMKKFGQQNLKSQKLFRLAALQQARLSATAERQASLGKLSNVKEKRGRARSSNSPHELLVGQDYIWESGTRRVVVATEEASELNKEFNNNYANKSVMSWDGIVRPISLYGDGNLSRMSTAAGGVNQYTNPVAPQPPLLIPDTGNPNILHDAYKLSIYTDYLNPFVTDPNKMYGESDGHDISIIAHGDGSDSQNLYVRGTGIPEYPDDCRPLVLRGPLVVKGWGYSTDNKPIPNEADDPVMIDFGQFTKDNTTDRFLDNWLRKSETWPAGPVDLRFDISRGVWVSPPTHRMVIGLALDTINAYGSGLCQLLEAEDLFDASGNALVISPSPCWCSPKFVLEDRIGKAVPSGARVIAYYDTIKNKYWALEQYGGLTTTTTTTTTTTFNPSVAYRCSGQCKFEWDQSTFMWNVTISGCVHPSSTTTPTTTTAAPGTTTTPCNCPSTSSTSSTTPAPTTSSTTTTASPTCNCQYPDFCGISNGDCTYTECASSEYIQTQIPNCIPSSGTTSTAPPSSTTTTTTTIAPPECTSYCCKFECNFNKNSSWQLIGCTYDSPPEYVCGDETYPCRSVGIPSEECGPGMCTVVEVCSENPSPTTESTCKPCAGDCVWWWVPPVYDEEGVWVNYGAGCEYGEIDYECKVDCWGTHTSKICGDITYPGEVNCFCVEPGASANQDSCIPVTTKCKAGPDLCSGGGGSGITTSTIPPTTTSGPCVSGCLWNWNGSSWSGVYNKCASTCQCFEPNKIGSGLCHYEHTPCVSGHTTTTSTTPPTTTTTPTPTTTTTCTPSGCGLSCVDLGPDGYKWVNGFSGYCPTATIGEPNGCVCITPQGFRNGCPCSPQYAEQYPIGVMGTCQTGSGPCPTTTTSTTTTCGPNQCTYTYGGAGWALTDWSCADGGLACPAVPTGTATEGDTQCLACCPTWTTPPPSSCVAICNSSDCALFTEDDYLAWIVDETVFNNSPCSYTQCSLEWASACNEVPSVYPTLIKCRDCPNPYNNPPDPPEMYGLYSVGCATLTTTPSP